MGNKTTADLISDYKKEENDIPIIESKLIWQFDHRLASYKDCTIEDKEKGNPIYFQLNEKQDLNSEIEPRKWISLSNFESKKNQWGIAYNWLFAYRNITNATNERTVIASIIPIKATDFSLRILFYSDERYKSSFLLLANFDSISFEYIVRQKIGGTNLSDYITKQLPVLPPEFYSEVDIEFIKPRVLELVYTAYDLKPFAEDMGYHAEPFQWDEERRANLKAELDAYYAKLYGLNRKQLRYILDPADLTPRELENILDDWEEVKDPLLESEYQKRCEASTFPGETFRVLKDKENRKYGEYRTRRLVLEKWEEMFGNKEE